jgi:hypothetical protein
MSKIQFAFDVSLYGETQSFSPTLSKGRVRIFYKGLNRNRTYITDEFAEHLLSSLPYAPIVGKYEDGDFSDHGRGEQLQVYGVIPAEPNIRWEKHLDYDGVEREYACADVLLWTARFPEASTILSKSQSMEIWPKSVKGDWVYSNGVKYFKFTSGSFLGLTALGENVEPCFEGAAFYELKASIDEFIKELNIYNKNNGGQEIMEEFKFKLSDSQKENAIFNLINPNLEDGYVDSFVCEVYDDYALCYNLYEGQYFRAYYNKDDETDTVEITDKVDAYFIDLVESEYEIVKRLRQNTSFEAIETDLESYSTLKDTYAAAETEYETKKTEFETEIENLNTQISELQEKVTTYEAEGQNYQEEKTVFEGKIQELNSNLEVLKQYQLDNENNIKSSYLNKFSAKLPENIVQELKDKLAEFSTEDFKKEVSIKVLEANEASLFNTNPEFIPQGELVEEKTYTGADKYMAQTLKNKGKM